jgi:glycosyltransferase involved in cell wall biosynthesis
VVPAYNESRSLEPLINRYASAARAAGLSSAQFRLVVVNNGSTDDSASVLEKLKKSALGEWFRSVDIQTNVGYGHGIFSGLSATSAPVVGYSHADQQCAPEDTFRARDVLTWKGPGRRLVKGVRSGRNVRDAMVTRVFEFLARVIVGLRATEINAQPKVFGRELLKELTAPPTHFAFDLYVLYRAQKGGYQFETIPVEFPGRPHGVSRWAATFLSRYRTIMGQILYMIRLVATEGRL